MLLHQCPKKMALSSFQFTTQIWVNLFFYSMNSKKNYFELQLFDWRNFVLNIHGFFPNFLRTLKKFLRISKFVPFFIENENGNVTAYSRTFEFSTEFHEFFKFILYFCWFTRFRLKLGSRHSSYTSHQSRISYTSHGDLLGTKEQKLRNRSSRNQSVVLQQPGGGAVYADFNHKGHRDYVNYFFSHLNYFLVISRDFPLNFFFANKLPHLPFCSIK